VRTKQFKHIFDRVVTLHGRNPRKEMPTDMPRAIVYHINERTRELVQGWPWPEWRVTEERSFRQVWRSDHQYYRANPATGNPDEVFYLPNTTYYRVLPTAPSDPVVGDLPTDTLHWSVLDPVDSYVAYDQPCKRSIGMVTGVYKEDPRMWGRNGSWCGGTRGCGDQPKLCYHPSEFGIDICNPPGPTVFICYSMPNPIYTMSAHVAGKTYTKGSATFDFQTGEVFQALNDTTAVLTDTSNWTWVPFLEKWESYVVNSAFADTLYEFDQGGNEDLQMRSMIAEKYENKAMNSLQGEVDALQAQGQVLKYAFCKPCFTFWCESSDWSGGTVTTLTDSCDQGAVFMPPPTQAIIPTRGSLWFTGSADPTPTNPPPAELQPQDMYLNGTTGNVFQFDGTTGTLAWRKV
jgi:hypothetical protein